MKARYQGYFSYGPLGTMRRAAWVLSATIAAIALTPSSADAQCYFQAYAYADGWVEDGTFYYMGSGMDSSPCGECYHSYGLLLTVTRVEDQVVTANLYNESGLPLGDQTNWVTPGHYEIDVVFGIGCYCSYQTYEAAAQKVVTVEAPPSCIPALRPQFTPPPNHVYAIDNSPPFPALGSAIDYAAGRWNNFVWGFTSRKAFTPSVEWPAGLTLIFRIEGSMVGGDDWAETRILESPIRVDVNPDLFGEPAMYDAVMLHEMGHARGYLHVGPGCADQSIMNVPFNNQTPYATGFGPGDTIATQRDIPPD